MKSVVYILSTLGLSTFGWGASVVLAQSTQEEDQSIPIADVEVEIPQGEQVEQAAESADDPAPASVSNDGAEDAVPAIEGMTSAGEPISCKAFADMPSEQRMEAIVMLDSSQGDKFCLLPTNASCLDFDSSMEEFGHLRPSSSPLHCKFVPAGSH